MKGVVLIILLTLCVSCKETEKEQITRLVKEWQGKEIVFPKSPVFTIQGKDTVNFSHADANYKILTYIDSVGCTSCKLQLQRWKKFIHEVDSLMNGKVPFLFYFHPKDRKELRYLTHIEDFTYPICIDIKDSLNQLNHFPNKMTYQTFLLDKDNRIVALGNPIHNSIVRELYLQMLTNKKVLPIEQITTKIKVDAEELDFGIFPFSEKQMRKFILTNTGAKSLVIYDVSTSCGCTQIEYDKQPVAPSESLELKVTYIADYPGYFRKNLNVYCNTEESPIRLTVKGVAE